MILSALLISTLLWARLDNGFVWVVVVVTFGFGAIGFADDVLKVRRFSAKGVPGRVRLGLGFLIALGASIWATSLQPEALQNTIALPVFKNALINAGLTIEHVGEYNHGYYQVDETWYSDEDRYWYPPGGPTKYPLLMSIKARKA